jgi:hypothetical protein
MIDFPDIGESGSKLSRGEEEATRVAQLQWDQNRARDVEAG